MPLTPASFIPPTELRASAFQLQVLSPSYAAEDFEAVVASASDIRNVFGLSNEWPSESISFKENLADLQRHEIEFRERKAFAYSMLDPSGKQYLGCVYIRPLESNTDPDLRKTLFDAQVFFWLSSLHCQTNVEQTLVALKSWLAQVWPFRRVAFPGREINWKRWERMTHELPHPTAPEA
jgi:hypothetical protein